MRAATDGDKADAATSGMEGRRLVGRRSLVLFVGVRIAQNRAGASFVSLHNHGSQDSPQSASHRHDNTDKTHKIINTQG